ncbi:hypothetical protein CJ030_MR3G009856 [Morella rubra]|uniref:Uncharacterized protein n=1 Tax=Morella rubra TaxID=262757 RepID=A0A6A1W7W0_9ROSI|nr:hypothetical protein CJ030_MR3G009856 [Morella rubra]
MRTVSVTYLGKLPVLAVKAGLHSREPHISTNYFIDDDGGGCAVYWHSLKFQRPATIKLRMQLVNSVSFFGYVDHPMKIINARTAFALAFTLCSL